MRTALSRMAALRLASRTVESRAVWGDRNERPACHSNCWRDMIRGRCAVSSDRAEPRGRVLDAANLGTVAMAGIGFFVVALISLHLLEPDFSAVNEYTSDYALGESFGWLMRAAFFAAGLASIAIALGLKRSLEPGKRVTATVALFLVAGVAFFTVGAFNGDPTGQTDLSTSGTVHVVGSVVLFVALVVAVWFLRGVFDRDRQFQRFASAQKWLAIAFTMGFVATFAVPEDGAVGAIQRIFVAILMAWLAFVAWTLRMTRTEQPAG